MSVFDAAKPAKQFIRIERDISHAAFRSRQFGRVESKLLANAADDAIVNDLARPAERRLRLPPSAVNRHDHRPVSALFLMMVETTPAFR
jgi:hypothetical protein